MAAPARPFVGAGGTLSAAIAAYLAHGLAVPEAVERAEQYTYQTLLHAQRYGMGRFVPNRFFKP